MHNNFGQLFEKRSLQIQLLKWQFDVMAPHSTHRNLSFDHWIFEFEFWMLQDLAYEIIANFLCGFITK